MRAMKSSVAAFAAAAALLSGVATSAHAECTRLGFSVNDYGKDGPSRDAQRLLDELIVKKMAERGVSNYKTGKKTVKCDLFLDFIVFDEHTCTAEATVCWGGSTPKEAPVTTGSVDPAPAAAPSAGEGPGGASQ